MAENILQSALEYARNGFAVIPSNPKNKVPLIKKWQFEASTDERQIKAWWQKFPWANVSIVTGAERGLVVI